MTRVYFVRHAQPECDYEDDRTRPLTAEGREDAKAILAFFRNMEMSGDKKIDGFYCSPYRRSMDTIAETAAFSGKEIITDERLRERQKGPDGNVHGMFQKRWADHNYHEEGGESLRMVQERSIAALEDILRANEDKNIVIGTHGTALSTILHYYDNSYDCDSFLRIIDWMPYIVELDFEGMEFVGKKEHLHIEKEFQGKIRADKIQADIEQTDIEQADTVLIGTAQAVPQLLYGTGNHAKLAAMQRRLEPLSLKIIGLKDIVQKFPSIPEVKEDGATPLENAEKKALAYYGAFRMPVFSCDSGLYFEGVPEEEQPGVHVRTVRGKVLTDEEMLEHYAGMAKKYGDLKAVYKNAVCLVIDEGHIHKAMDKSMESEPFLITSRPHKDGIREKGFPLDCLSVHIGTGSYYYDLPENKLDQIALEDGFLDFFKQYVKTVT